MPRGRKEPSSYNAPGEERSDIDNATGIPPRRLLSRYCCLMAPSKSLELETFAIDGNVVLRLHPRFIDVIGVKYGLDVSKDGWYLLRTA